MVSLNEIRCRSLGVGGRSVCWLIDDVEDCRTLVV